jgi:hypothetical protein
MGEEDFAVLEDVVYELFGDAVDPRELSDVISKMDDASEMHVPTGAAQKSHRKKMVVNTVGQGLNALAIGAGTHALVMAGKDERLHTAGVADKAAGKKTFARAASAPYRAYEGTGMHKWLESKMGQKKGVNMKYAIPAAGGALALHSAELVGDSIAARALSEQRKTPKDMKSVVVNRADAKTKALVKKSLGQIVDARRRGVISTDQAIAMAAMVVEKADKPLGEGFEREAEKIVPFTYHGAETETPAKPTKELGLKPKTPSVKPKPFKTPKSPNDVKTSFGKSESPDLTWSGEISKMDTDKRQVFGFCTVTHVNGEPVIDLQGDYVPLEEIEKAAYGDMHTRDGEQPLHTSDMIESVIITPEKLESWGLAKDAMPYGWWVGFKVNDDDQWEKVKKNERTGFSIHGSGKRVEKSMDSVSKGEYVNAQEKVQAHRRKANRRGQAAATTLGVTSGVGAASIMAPNLARLSVRYPAGKVANKAGSKAFEQTMAGKVKSAKVSTKIMDAAKGAHSAPGYVIAGTLVAGLGAAGGLKLAQFGHNSRSNTLAREYNKKNRNSKIKIVPITHKNRF